jgi:hypothetical protein
MGSSINTQFGVAKAFIFSQNGQSSSFWLRLEAVL